MKKTTNAIPFKFTNEVNEKEHVMVINGAIGESGWLYDATSANDVREALDDIQASTIRIKLNSGGGDAFEGIEIMNYLKDLDAKVIVEVTALAASAASIIAMGADEIIMREGSTMMIHEASTMAYGTKSDMQKTLNALESIDQSLVDIYANKTGLSQAEVVELLVAETWMTGPEALAKGFATSVATPVKPKEDDEMEKVVNDLKLQVSNLQKQIDNKKEEPQPLVTKQRRLGF